MHGSVAHHDQHHVDVHDYLHDPQGIRPTRVQSPVLNGGDGGSDYAQGTPKNRG